MGLLLLLLLILIVALGYRAIGERGRGIVSRAMKTAFIVGGVGFLIGFVGPVIVTPEANQGPLLGIFFTGPLGFLVGLLWGIAREWRRGEAREDR
jgi:hypothetical protein